MEKLTMCRVCLAQDVRMYCIVNTPLKNMYEKLAVAEFETKDIRPVQACYICCARLQNCYLLKMNCLRSEELFTQMISDNMFETKDIRPVQACYICCARLQNCYLLKMNCLRSEELFTQMISDNMINQLPVETANKFKLKMTPVVHIDIGNSVKNNTKCNIKMESEDLMDTVEIKEECIEDIYEEENNSTIVIDNIQSLAPKNHLVKEEIEDNSFNITDTNICAKLKPGENYEDATLIEQIKDEQNETETFENNTNNITYHTNKTEKQILNKKLLEKITKNKCNFIENNVLNKDLLTDNKKKIYKCDVCERIFSRLSNLKAHTKIHTNSKPYMCDTCKKTFSQKSNLMTHNLMHANKRQFKCNLCTKSFNRKWNLDNHVTSHLTEKPYKCEVCKISFKRKQNLNGHLRQHTSDNKYKCRICDKTFNQKAYLDVHTRTHSGEKPYKCGECQRCFSIKGNLSKHLRTHNSETPKPFMCDTCKKCFYNKSDLVRHIRVHTGQKPFKCHLCDKRFAQGSTLKSHIRRHMGFTR